MNDYSSNITYGRENIAFDVFYTERKTMEIAVLPDERVVVKAPQGTEPQVIKTRLVKRARWIRKQLDYFRQFNPPTPPRRYVGGETHLYLGRQFRLKISVGLKNGVKLSRGFFHVICSRTVSPERVQKQLQRWYLEKAKVKFAESLERCLPDFHRIGLSPPSLNIRKMNSRWGSLSPRSTLTLNVDLIRAPRECTEYVITHELCHLQHPNHDAEFYRLLEQLIPDWEKRKHRLELALV
jgi:predicted metal-dependent hydrolase